MAKVIEAVQIFKKVEDVTSAKDDPPPVYLMDEVAELAKSSADNAEKVADRISKRLQHKSANTKYKALRLVKHLCNKGCSSFQRSMQRHASLIRDLLTFKGEQDPFCGDIPNQRVRDSAKEAVDALFNTIIAAPVTGLGARIQGFGSSAASGVSAPAASSNSSSTPSQSRMTGFGGGSASTAGAPSASSSGGGGAFRSGAAGSRNVPLSGTSASMLGTSGSYVYGRENSGGGSAHSQGYTAPAYTSNIMGTEDTLVEDICTPGGLRPAPDAEQLRKFVEAASSMDGLRIAELLRGKMESTLSWQQLLRALCALEAVLQQGSTQACGEIAVMFQSDPAPVQAAAQHAQQSVRERAVSILRHLGADAGAPAPSQQQQQAAGHQRNASYGDALDGLSAGVAPATGSLLGDFASPPRPVHQRAPSGGQGMMVQPQQQQMQAQAQQLTSAASAGDTLFSGLHMSSPQAPYQQLVYGQPAAAGYGAPAAYAAAPAPTTIPAAQPEVDLLGGALEAPAQPQAAPQQQQTYQQMQQQQPTIMMQPPQQQQQPQNLLGLMPGMAPMQQPQQQQPPVQQQQVPVQQQQQKLPAARAPLDDIFADMSLGSGGPATPAPSLAPSNVASTRGSAVDLMGMAGSTQQMQQPQNMMQPQMMMQPQQPMGMGMGMSGGMAPGAMAGPGGIMAGGMQQQVRPAGTPGMGMGMGNVQMPMAGGAQPAYQAPSAGAAPANDPLGSLLGDFGGAGAARPSLMPGAGMGVGMSGANMGMGGAAPRPAGIMPGAGASYMGMGMGGAATSAAAPAPMAPYGMASAAGGGTVSLGMYGGAGGMMPGGMMPGMGATSAMGMRPPAQQQAPQKPDSFDFVKNAF